MNPYTLQAALRAAGNVILAVDLVMHEKYDAVFCNVRTLNMIFMSPNSIPCIFCRMRF